MEFPKTLSRFFGIHVPKPPCKIWDLEHIRCYHKSTLPLSEECALVMQPAEASLCSVTSPSMLLMSDMLSTNHCANVASVLLLTLPLSTLHPYCNSLWISASVLLLALRLPTNSALQTAAATATTPTEKHPKPLNQLSLQLSTGKTALMLILHCSSYTVINTSLCSSASDYTN